MTQLRAALAEENGPTQRTIFSPTAVNSRAVKPAAITAALEVPPYLGGLVALVAGGR